jgi:hypothetical protein
MSRIRQFVRHSHSQLSCSPHSLKTPNQRQRISHLDSSNRSHGTRRTRTDMTVISLVPGWQLTLQGHETLMVIELHVPDSLPQDRAVVTKTFS